MDPWPRDSLVNHVPYHPEVVSSLEVCNGLLKTQLEYQLGGIECGDGAASTRMPDICCTCIRIKVFI